jgi:hypothetical protein
MNKLLKVIIILFVGLVLFMLSVAYNKYVYQPKHANDGIDITAQFLINDNDSSVISETDSMLFIDVISRVKYHIIIGSFEDVENAKKLQYIYPDCKLLPVTDSGFHRVSILEYDNIDDCIEKLKSFKVNNGDAWILKQ